MDTELKQLRHTAEAEDAYGVKSTRAWNEYYRALDATRTPFHRIATRYALPVSVAILSVVTVWVAWT